MKRMFFLAAIVLGSLSMAHAQTDSLHLKVKKHKLKEDVKAVPHQTPTVVHDAVPVPVPVPVETPAPAPAPAPQPATQVNVNPNPNQPAPDANTQQPATTVNVNTNPTPPPPPAPAPAPNPKVTETTTTTVAEPVTHEHTAAVSHTARHTTRTSAQLRRRSANTHYSAASKRTGTRYKTTTTTKVTQQ